MKVRRMKSPSHDRTLAVEEGQVVCPRVGIVDIERCWICPAFDGLSSGHFEGVVCRSSTRDAIAPRSIVS